jgi:Cu/Ag efflux pump CusA
MGIGLICRRVAGVLHHGHQFSVVDRSFIIITALPGAFCGIIWMLFLTGTSFQRAVPDGRDHECRRGYCEQHFDGVVRQRAIAQRDEPDRGRAGRPVPTRLRPVLMTAAAMVIGMAPMASGLGEGGEQNAPLGRAVIGGLILATVATLLFVPVVFSLLRRHGVPKARFADSRGDSGGGCSAIRF